MGMVLRTEPLLLRAGRGNAFGRRRASKTGEIWEAGFLYLLGKVDADAFLEAAEQLKGRQAVCLSEDWEEFLSARYASITRTLMQTMTRFPALPTQSLSPEYEIRPFGEAEYAAHPFWHGRNYPDWPAFSRDGSGAVAYCGDEIVSSASSFLTYQGEVELDISTSPEHRRHGLARACACGMLRDCEARGIPVHWDAQNPESRALAERLGFRVEQEYAAYLL